MIQPRAILVLRFSSIGDIIQTTSVVGSLKCAFPDASIDFMTLSKYAPLLEGHPHINKVHALDINARYMSLKRVGFEMETMGYDLAIDLHNTTRSRIIRKAMVKTKTVSIKKPRWVRFKLFALHWNEFSDNFSVRTWLNEPLKSFLKKDMIQSKTELFISNTEKFNARSLIKSKGINSSYFVIAPGAAWSQKRWLADRYATVINQCIRDYGLSPVLIGGSRDAICDLIKNTTSSKVVDLHGKTNLRESLAIVSQAKFVLGSDTGFIHAGEALKVPAITLLGPTSRQTGAGIFNKGSQVVEQSELWCRPCSQNGSIPCYRKEQYCMTGIRTEDVIDAVGRVVSI